MTDPTPILFVYGVDNEGWHRVLHFAAKDAVLATKPATLVGFRLAWITDETGRAIAERLPDGNVFARCNGYVRHVRQSVFDKVDF